MPTKEQIQALKEWAAVHGARRWKSKLCAAWMTGNYESFNHTDAAAYLQQVRNTLGPTWLDRFTLED